MYTLQAIKIHDFLRNVQVMLSYVRHWASTLWIFVAGKSQLGNATWLHVKLELEKTLFVYHVAIIPLNY